MRDATDRPHPTTLEQDCASLHALLIKDIESSGLTAEGARLLVMAGLPGTGKSHFTRELVSLSPFLVLETDRLRKALVAQPRYTPGEHRRVFGACHRLIEQFLEEGYPVLFDATNLTDRFRDPLYEIAERAGAPVAVAAITAPRETVRRRLYARKDGLDRDTNSDADWQVYCRMAPHWEPVSREHFAVDTSEDIGPVLQQVVHWAATAKPPKPPGVRAR